MLVEAEFGRNETISLRSQCPVAHPVHPLASATGDDNASTPPFTSKVCGSKLPSLLRTRTWTLKAQGNIKCQHGPAP